MTEPIVETLWCEPGGHEWIRTRKRGVKPKACAEHGGRPRALRGRGRRAAGKKPASEQPAPSPALRRRPYKIVEPPPLELRADAELRARRAAHLRAQRAARPAPPAPSPVEDRRTETLTRPFEPIYGHLGDAVIARRTGRDSDVAAALRRLAATAELLALDLEP